MFRTPHYLLNLFALGLGTGLAAAGQVAAPSAQQNLKEIPTLTQTTRLVVLDVVVTDKSGRIVPGLDRGDFTVLEEGRPQAVRTFEGLEEHRLPAGVQIDSTADLGKAPQAPVTILVLDELNTAFTDMSYAREALKSYIERQPATLTQPTTLLAVSNTRFQVLQDYTLNRQQLLTALHHHFPEYPWRLMHSGKGGPGTAERLALSLGSLEQIAQASSGHAGRKNLVWVGRGFPAINVQESTDRDAVVLLQGLRHATEVLREARITLSSIDPTIASSGSVLIETPDDLDAAENENGSDPFAGEMNFQLLAPATGGRVYASRNDVDAQIANTIRDGGNYYTLSYTPDNSSDAAQPYRRIQVKMNRPGLQATTRNGYYMQPAVAASAVPGESNLNLKKLAFDLGSAANSNLAYTGLTVSARRLAESETFAVLVASKDLSQQVGNHGDSEGEITLMIASFNGSKMLTHQIGEMKAHFAAATPFAEFHLRAAIPPEANRVRVVVRDAGNGKIGTVDLGRSEFIDPAHK